MDSETEDTAFAAEVDRVEAAIAAEKKSKEWAKTEALRCAVTSGKNKKKSAWARLVKNDGTILWMLRACPPRRTKADQVIYEASIAKTRTRLHQMKLSAMRKMKAESQKVKDARARRIAHHSKYLEEKIKKEKAAKLARLAHGQPFFEECNGMNDRVSVKGENGAGMTHAVHERDLLEGCEKNQIATNKEEDAELARLIRKRDLLVECEKKRIAMNKEKDAQMARAVAHRILLESIALRSKKDSP